MLGVLGGKREEVNGDALDANRSVKWFLMATGAALYPLVFDNNINFFVIH
jgi:hypothetical protein